jgi:hypothetical protein
LDDFILKLKTLPVELDVLYIAHSFDICHALTKALKRNNYLPKAVITFVYFQF